jgi:hypothetical protein
LSEPEPEPDEVEYVPWDADRQDSLDENASPRSTGGQEPEQPEP